MNTETYLKLAALAAILIIALVYPVVSALVLTGVAAWHLQDFKISKISEMALVKKVVQLFQLTPPGLKALIISSVTNLKALTMSRTASLLPSAVTPPLALPTSNGSRDALPMAHMTVSEPRRNWWFGASEGRLARRLR